ncbi:hypothetical protein CDD80_7067 [Ophiocordyceps camponoti-rufipedis]|uniref:Formin GTPase-binding domain-containing protein n=1 Tax=Ophiocordyceps camponoti-rufipedis TaxID=2004952 RepID=A0A2C5ZF12_9HYPO|nr:hypothetical protein CDD80_7067 [Ophiocordyceps camponoti-rufipedis]
MAPNQGLISFLQRRQAATPRGVAVEGRVQGVVAAGRFAALGEVDDNRQQQQQQQETGKKTKSSSHLAGLLSRPKSLKNLYRLASEDDDHVGKNGRDKENRKPDDGGRRGGGGEEAATPIFAEFTTRDSPRPKSLHVAAPTTQPKPTTGPQRGRMLLDALGGRHAAHRRSKSAASTMVYPRHVLEPDDINRQLEELLDRRNIPENQRYKMRNLSDTIKTEFIRQDWAEMQAAAKGIPLVDTPNSPPTADPSDDEQQRPKRRGRGRSFTFSRSSGKKESKKNHHGGKADGNTLGRHLRSKSTESIVTSDRPLSLHAPSSVSTGLLGKMKLQQGPGDYVAYLARVQSPEVVEVGRLHKLRLLLRNETVAWIEEFIQLGGMEQIVGLLHRIMGVEWREEHEDALLHENLLCLKALSTTARAMAYLDSVQSLLFPRLLHLLFDPEKKGPSEFTTRNIITSLLLTYIESAAPVDRVSRAGRVLAHLRDKQPSEAHRPLPFVMEMRQERPYRVWCKEVVSVTKEVFWIFLHNLNVVALASCRDDQRGRGRADEEDAAYGYMLRHFPPERPPVPAAPYVGGVEWDATNYLASHLDLVNAILASTPSTSERNALRGELRVSGWERCLGGSLRLCKDKFYGAVHVGLRTWVAAAAEDGWDVRDVRFGPGPEARASSPVKAGVRVKMDEAPPKLALPNLDSKTRGGADAWL